MRLVGKIFLQRAGDGVSRGRWCITCEAHVTVKLKRVFARIYQDGQHVVHFLSDTPENACDLMWFISRYPMAVKPMGHLERRAREFKDRQTVVDQLLAASTTSLPEFVLAEPAREYQKLPAAIVLRKRSILVADELGLGKTVEALCLLTRPETRPAVVVTLPHLAIQWQRMAARFLPDASSHILRTATPYDISKPRRGEKRASGRVPDIILTSYSKLDGWAQTLAAIAKTTIFDEVQELRRPENGRGEPTKKYAASKHLAENAEYRMGLSGSPIYNYGDEMHAILDVLDPDCLGTRLEFKREWCHSDGRNSLVTDPSSFGRYLRGAGLMIRRTRQEVGRELPGLQRVVHHIDASPVAMEQVSPRCRDLAQFILGRGPSPYERVDGDKSPLMRAAQEFSNMLRQATGIAKAPYVAAFARLLLEQDDKKLVVYCWHRAVYDILMSELEPFYPVMYTGSESPRQKDEARKRFCDEGSRVLLISLRAGAGLDGLQFASKTVVHAELDWSPAVHNQADGRVFRDGQTEAVLSYYLKANCGSDPVVADVLGVKELQAHGVNDPDAEFIDNMQVDPDHVKKLAEGWLRQQGDKREALDAVAE